jgi:hypothetical protein
MGVLFIDMWYRGIMIQSNGTSSYHRISHEGIQSDTQRQRHVCAPNGHRMITLATRQDGYTCRAPAMKESSKRRYRYLHVSARKKLCW